MKAKHHFWSSLAVGGALYWATGSSAALAGSMVGGFLIDTNVISEFVRPEPSSQVKNWFEAADPESLSA